MTDSSRQQIFQTAVGLSITTRCPIRCAHCIVDAGPHRKDDMAPDRATDLIHQCARYESGKIKTVIITGGEPFSCPALLKTILETNSALGLVSVVVTNAFWARSIKTAEETLDRYPQIDILSISTDRYHRRFIPATHVRHAIRAAEKRNIPVSAAVCIESPDDLLASIEALDGVTDIDQMRITPLLPAGRARDLEDAAFAFSENAKAGEPCTGADFPLIFPDGRVMSCMGILKIPCGVHPLQPGNVNAGSVSEILNRAEQENFLHAMRSLGRDWIVARIDEVAETKIDLTPYRKFGSCSLCYAMAHDIEFQKVVLACLSRTDVASKIALARLRMYGESSTPGNVDRALSI